MDQGWVLVLLTSLITVLGCCVIYIDVIYSTLFPKRASYKPFKISQDTNFLICSLALSSGSLIFTSLYKLLPKSHSYLKIIPLLNENPKLLKSIEYSCYLIGILLCSGMNMIVHLFTNESLVHCAHDASHNTSQNIDIDSHSHSHSYHQHGDDIESQSFSNEYNDVHSYNLIHEGDDTFHHDNVEEVKISSDSFKSSKSPIILQNKQLNQSEIPEPHPKLEPTISKDKDHHDSTLHHTLENSRTISLVDLSIKKITGETPTGECFGNIDSCTDDILTSNKLHRHKSTELHFCSKPSEENLLFFPNKKHMITDRMEFSSRYPNLDIHSPLIANDHLLINNYNTINNSNNNNNKHNHPHHHHNSHNHHHDYSNAYSSPHPAQIQETITSTPDTPDLETSYLNNSEHSSYPSSIEEHIDHHHHIRTPLSRLLSIGLQTIMAITLHKFPEGFIMYSTSKANPALGLSIFLSMFIHNFVEGFTMTLPIYIALDSRVKALLIAGTLGGFSQPIGALIGYYMFRGQLDLNDPFSIILIAVLLSITSGFLTFISLQMFASAIGFGGKQDKVLKWSFIGISLISLSNILV
jgi:ZIP family zinc transporter